MIKHSAVRKDNIIYVGKRHCDCFHLMATLEVSHVGSLQGFITDSGIFLDREEALAYAMGSKQLIGGKKQHNPVDQLTSEDLW